MMINLKTYYGIWKNLAYQNAIRLIRQLFIVQEPTIGHNVWICIDRTQNINCVTIWNLASFESSIYHGHHHFGSVLNLRNSSGSYLENKIYKS